MNHPLRSLPISLLTFASLLLALSLASCASEQQHHIFIPPAAQADVVHVTQYRYVRIDDKLTQRCTKAMPVDHTVGEAVHVAHARGSCVDQLNDHMDVIRKIQGTAVPASGQSGS